MNTEEKHTSRRFRWGTLGYWLIIAVLMYFCASPAGRGGHGGRGNGPGGGTVGDGPGAGSGPGHVYYAPGAGEGSTAKTPAKQPEKSVVNDSAQKKTAPPAPPVSQSPAAKAPAAPKPMIPAPKTVLEFGETPAAASAAPSGGGAKKGFFGVDTVNDGNLLYILDVSSSMGSSTADSKTRIELLKSELIKELERPRSQSAKKDAKGRILLDGSAGSQYFRIITFSNQVSFFPGIQEKALSFSQKKDILGAKKFAQSCSPFGGTAMLHTWSDPGTQKLLKNGFFQTVCFLSDGEPNDCTHRQLLDFLKQNYPQLRIHTFSMGQESRLLKNIAAQHHGVYKVIY